MEMTKFHGIRPSLKMEGFMRSTQYRWFEALFTKYEIQHVAEVGFNGGHSAFTFANLGAKSVTSFDLGEHPCVQPGANYLKTRFPNTSFQLVLGDSRDTIAQHEGLSKFDAVFIDGGHDFATAASDIVTLRALSKPDALVIMDDYGSPYKWGLTGPKDAYDRAVQALIINPIEVTSGDLRSWALGRFRAN